MCNLVEHSYIICSSGFQYNRSAGLFLVILLLRGNRPRLWECDSFWKAGIGSDTRCIPFSLPVIGTSGRGCSFLQEGTNTVMSTWPRSRKKFTASWIPRQEKTSLFPWLQTEKVNFTCKFQLVWNLHKEILLHAQTLI